MTGLSLALVLAGACRRGPDPAEQLWEQSTRVTLQTVAALGPHHSETVVVRIDEGGSSERRTTESLVIDWVDFDHFEVRRGRDGQVRSVVRVVDGQAWVRQEKGPFRKARDAELYRQELAGNWDLWNQGLQPFRWRLTHEAVEQGVVEGRPTWVYRLGLSQEQDGRDRRWEPVELEGTVHIDAATGVPLLGQAQGVTARTRGNRRRRIEVSLVRTGFGEPIEIRAPGRARE